MVKVVFIARKSDGLLFCEISSENNDDKNLTLVRNRALEFLKTMQTKSKLGTVNIDNQNFVLHYKINDNIVYLTICDLKYPQKLVFLFLEEINEGFLEELKNVFGSGSVDYYSKLETIDRAYHFIKFEKFLKKKKQEFNESSSKQVSDKLNREIQEVHKIMVENINLLMDREKNLDSKIYFNKAISRISSSMKDDSKIFKKKAYEVRIKLLLSKYAPLIAIVLVILLVILFKIYF